MTNAPGSTGTTVTVFGDSNPLDHALNDELGRRGCKTHFVSVPTGWLRSVTHAVVRLDTAAGVEALKQLVHVRQPRSHVIAVCPQPADAAESDWIREMCRACGKHHDVALIWHPPLEASMSESAEPLPETAATTEVVAATVADEMAEHASVGRPAFVTRPLLLEPHPH